MNKKTLWISTYVAVFLVIFVMNQSVPVSYARDGGDTQGTASPQITEGDNRASETPDSEHATESPENRPERPSMSPLANPRNASEQQKKAIEKINEAQEKLGELNLKLAKEVVTVPQNVQTLADLAGQKITDAKAALASQDFGAAFGHAQSAESLIKNALRALENEQEAEHIQSDLNKEIEDEDISSIEIDTEASQSGSLDIEHKDKTHTTRSVPFSSTSLFQVQMAGGLVGVHVASGSRAVIDNEDIDIESDFPLILNVASRSFSVKTPEGIQEIKALPAQAFAHIDKHDKPDILKKVSLLEQDGKLIFEADGSREGKIFGLIPFTVSVKTAVDAQTGAIVSIDKPWFIDFLGPLFR